MYAIIQSGGKQVKVQSGETILFEKIKGEKGDNVEFDKVLLVAEDDNIKVGQPLIGGASVSGEIVEQGRDKKVVVFKFQRRKNVRKKQGHRQDYTAVKIGQISG